MAQLSDFHRDYWNAFQAFAQADMARLPRSLPSYSYMIFRLGIGGAHLAASVLVSKNLVTFYLLIEGKNRDEMYHHLSAHQSEIDTELRETPVWNKSGTSNRARVTVELNVDDLENRNNWPRQHGWIIEKAKIFDSVFHRRLHELKATS